MVTKRELLHDLEWWRSVLAKIHMVTKLCSPSRKAPTSSVLAKIHMVTKHNLQEFEETMGSVLAKIHMVTKHGSLLL